MLCLKPSLTFVQLGCFSWQQKPWGPSTAKSNSPSPRFSLGFIDGLHFAKKRRGNMYVMWKTHCSSTFSIRKHICSPTLITTSDAVEAPIMHFNIRRVHEPTAKKNCGYLPIYYSLWNVYLFVSRASSLWFMEWRGVLDMTVVIKSK